MEDWQSNLVRDDAGIREIFQGAKRMAVLGIKTEAQEGQPAFFVPEYLQRAGYDIIPVPVYFPDVTTILGKHVHRRVADIPGGVELVVVFRRSQDVTSHVDDVLAAKPQAVWLQSGIANDEAAERWARAGIKVVQNRCSMVDHRRLMT